MKRVNPAKRHTHRGKSDKPSHVTPLPLSAGKRGSMKTFSITSDKGKRVTATEGFGDTILVYEGGAKPRKATPSEIKRYAKAFREAEDQFFKE